MSLLETTRAASFNLTIFLALTPLVRDGGGWWGAAIAVLWAVFLFRTARAMVRLEVRAQVASEFASEALSMSVAAMERRGGPVQ